MEIESVAQILIYSVKSFLLQQSNSYKLTREDISRFIQEVIIQNSCPYYKEELVRAASDYAQTIFHPVGTCKMGKGEDAVVNDKLQAHGLQNLRVVDASIMPNITSGNTNAPTIMIAEKASDMILNK